MVDTTKRLKWHTIYSASDPKDVKVAEGQAPTKYIVILVEEENENPNDISASKAFTKVLFENTHPLAFGKILKGKEAGKLPRVEGSFHNIEVNPYYPKNAKGEYFKDANGIPRVASRVTFFLLTDESVSTALRQATRNLEFVDLTNSTDTNESKAAALTINPEGMSIEAQIKAATTAV
jgi:hypothetical protein